MKRWVALILAAVLCLGAFIGGGLHFSWNKSEWASWVQAVGSIAAILAAWGGIQYQLKREEAGVIAAKLSDVLDMTQACYLTTFDAWLTLRHIADQFSYGVGRRVQVLPDRVEDLQRSFQTLAFKDLSPQLLVEMHRVQRELSYTLLALKQVHAEGVMTEARLKRARHRTINVKAVADRLEAELNAKGDLWRDSVLLVDAQDMDEMNDISVHAVAFP